MARSALNLLQTAGVRAESAWQALRPLATRVEGKTLRFADGSTLRFNPEAEAFLAL